MFCGATTGRADVLVPQMLRQHLEATGTSLLPKTWILKMKKLAILATATLLLGGVATSTMAADLFDRADGNHDGVISMSEAQGIYSRLDATIFNQADANGNGVLDIGEFTELRGLSAGL
jgi:hypothetical protein